MPVCFVIIVAYETVELEGIVTAAVGVAIAE